VPLDFLKNIFILFKKKGGTMNIIIDKTPEQLQETYRRMLTTLEYGGSVNPKILHEIELRLKETEPLKQPTLNS
jgi:hypothetical protein